MSAMDKIDVLKTQLPDLFDEKEIPDDLFDDFDIYEVSKIDSWTGDS